MKFIKWLEKHFEDLICCSCLAIIAVSVFSQVVARYIFEVALHWTEEVASICMVWAVYMGAALCVKERFHIRILVAVKALPNRLSRLTIFFADFCWAFFCIIMIKVSADYLFVLWKYTEHSPSLGINQFYPRSVLIIGYSLMLIRLIQYYFRWFQDGATGLPGMLEEDSEINAEDQEKSL